MRAVIGGERYAIQVATDDGWALLQPVGGDPYLWESLDAARTMMKMCYPHEHASKARIVRVTSFIEVGEVVDGD